MTRTVKAFLAALAAFGWLSASPAFAQMAVTSGEGHNQQQVVFDPLPQPSTKMTPAAAAPAWLRNAEAQQGGLQLSNNAGHNENAVTFGPLPQASPDYLTASPSAGLQRLNNFMQSIEGAQTPG